jgi:GGDEF domain-containing protein
MAVAGRIHTALARAFGVDGQELIVTASIGISLASAQLGSSEVLRNPDIAAAPRITRPWTTPRSLLTSAVWFRA